MDNRIGPDHDVLGRTLADDVTVVETVRNSPTPESEWQAVCRAEDRVWLVEKATANVSSRADFIVYRGERYVGRTTGNPRYERRDFLGVFDSAERAAAFVNEQVQ